MDPLLEEIERNSFALNVLPLDESIIMFAVFKGARGQDFDRH